MPTVRDRVGERIGRLMIVEELPRRGKHIMWLCRCDCGNRITAYSSNLKRDESHTTSCGCVWRESVTSHGEAHSRLWQVWKSMKSRCLNSNNPKYADYGGRGIKVCKIWLDPAVFITWGKANGYRPGLTLDRENNNGNYTPRNCRWATRSQQQRNRRVNRILTFKGRSMPMVAWLDEPGVRGLGLDLNVLRSRLRYGWTVKQALTLPVRRGYSLKSRL